MKILSPIELNIVTYTASITLAKIDGGKLILMNGATTNNITVPANASVNFPIGTQIVIIQKSAIQTTFVADAGVTINSANSILNILNRYGNAILVKTATNTWELSHEVDLSNLNASNLTSGTVPTARLGSGTANSTTYLRGDNTWATISAGGLTKFTEAESTTSPNNTVYVDSITAIGASTNVDIALVPKGSGAFLLAIPDGTTTGGSKRGTYAVDLQTVRNSASHVASGTYSSIVGGARNSTAGSYAFAMGYTCEASGNFGSVALGYLNTASGESSITLGNSNTASNTQSISMGRSNNCSGYVAVCIGESNISNNTNSVAIGKSNTASGSYSIAMGQSCNATSTNSICIGGYTSASTSSAENSVVLGWGIASATRANALGFANTANGLYSTALGYGANTNSIIGKIAFSGWYVDTRGDNQKGFIRLGRRTTDATTSTLTADNSATVNSTTQLALQNQQLIRFKGSITGKQTASTNIGVWDIDGVIVRGANAGSTTLVVSNVTLVTNASGWGTPTLTADTTNGSLKIDVQGLAGTSIQWLVILDTTENLY